MPAPDLPLVTTVLGPHITRRDIAGNPKWSP